MKTSAAGGRRSWLVLGFACAALLAVSPVQADAQADQDEAVAAAKDEATRWLAALDSGRHAESWSEAASVMKEGRTEEDWVREIATPRESFGKSIMRELDRAEFSTVVRGAPVGKYVTLRYLTQFTNAPPVSETILLVLENDRWRIAGYTLERAPDLAPAPAQGKPATPAEAKPATPADAKSALPLAPAGKKSARPPEPKK